MTDKEKALDLLRHMTDCVQEMPCDAQIIGFDGSTAKDLRSHILTYKSIGSISKEIGKSYSIERMPDGGFRKSIDMGDFEVHELLRDEELDDLWKLIDAIRAQEQ